ncbi:MAG: SurA N-terminal domain-containing protein [Pseudomonadota bacterium]
MKALRGNTIFMWIIMGLLFVGLVGFGAVGTVGLGGGGAATVAEVAGERVRAEDYARELQREQRTIIQQVGRAVSLEELRNAGVNANVLQRLLRTAALSGEAREAGISASDAQVRDYILEAPDFGGPGAFSQEVYELVLAQGGLNASEYEDEVRKEIARDRLQNTVTAGARVPEVAVTTVLGGPVDPGWGRGVGRVSY